ncbi:hypothetical protein [Thiomonas sp.]
MLHLLRFPVFSRLRSHRVPEDRSRLRAGRGEESDQRNQKSFGHSVVAFGTGTLRLPRP